MADFAARVLFAADRTTKALALHTSTDERAEMLDALTHDAQSAASPETPADPWFDQCFGKMDGLFVESGSPPQSAPI